VIFRPKFWREHGGLASVLQDKCWQRRPSRNGRRSMPFIGYATGDRRRAEESSGGDTGNPPSDRFDFLAVDYYSCHAFSVSDVSSGRDPVTRDSWFLGVSTGLRAVLH